MQSCFVSIICLTSLTSLSVVKEELGLSFWKLYIVRCLFFIIYFPQYILCAQGVKGRINSSWTGPNAFLFSSDSRPCAKCVKPSTYLPKKEKNKLWELFANVIWLWCAEAQLGVRQPQVHVSVRKIYSLRATGFDADWLSRCGDW